MSICEWGHDKPWEWGPAVGHLWRTTGDIHNCFDCVEDHGHWKSLGVMRILDKQEGLRQYAGPGHWNDPDMLEVGNGMPANEDRAHFAMWSMLAAPLITGNDLRNMSKETQEIMTNREVIAINQDKLGVQGLRYTVKDSVETWLKPLSDGKWALCFLNRSNKPQPISFDWKTNVVNDPVSKMEFNASSAVYKIRDVWAHKETGTTQKSFSATVPKHEVIMLVLSK